MGNYALTLSCRRSLSYRNQSISLQNKSMDWFLYGRDLLRERVKGLTALTAVNIIPKSPN